MEQRVLGRTRRSVGVMGLGAWQLGADWGDIDEDAAHAVLRAAVESGVTFIDTADVYGDGRSEKLIAQFRNDARVPAAEVMVATKMGRREAEDPANFTLDSFRRWTGQSPRTYRSTLRRQHADAPLPPE